MGKIKLQRNNKYAGRRAISLTEILAGVIAFFIVGSSMACGFPQPALAESNETPKVTTTITATPKEVINTPIPTVIIKTTLAPEEVDFGVSERLNESYIVDDVMFLDLDINNQNVFVLGLFKEDAETGKLTVSYLFGNKEIMFTMKAEDFYNFFSDTKTPFSYEVNMGEISDDSIKLNGVTVLPALEYYLYVSGKGLNTGALEGNVSIPGVTMTIGEIKDWYTTFVKRENWFVPSEYTNSIGTGPTPTSSISNSPTLEPEEIDFGMSEENLNKSYKVEDVFFLDLMINDANVYTLGLQTTDRKTGITTISYFFNNEEKMFSMDITDFTNFFNGPSTPISYDVGMGVIADDDVKIKGVTVLPGLESYLINNNKPGTAEAINSTISNPDSVMKGSEIQEWFKKAFYRENIFVPSDYQNTKGIGPK